MKTIFLLLALCFSWSTCLIGKIKNGYELNLAETKASLHELKLYLQVARGLPLNERLDTESKIEEMISFISCYELTDQLIGQLRIVSPDIFMDIDTLKNQRGRETDVYIKLVPQKKSRLPLQAASFIHQSKLDPDVSFSEYGMHSVSVEICMSDNALFLLSHELGHVKYIVPNLAVYTKFYQNRYNKCRGDLSFIGHSHRDESGNISRIFEKKYLHDRAVYLESGGKKFQGFVGLFYQLNRAYRKLEPDEELWIVRAYSR
jgi:hypothetical protein